VTKMVKRAYLVAAIILLTVISPLYGETLKAVATIYPLASIVASVGGERVRVKTLVPPGASPHDYELRPSDLAEIRKASLLAMVGAHLDQWLDKALKKEKKAVFILTQGLVLEGGNPHVWLDPILVEKRVPALVDVLSRLDPEGAAYYEARGKAFMEELEALTKRIRKLLAPLPCREYLSQHGAWLYFGERFGLTCLGVVEEVPGREPGPRRFMELVKLARSHPRVLLFTDKGENPRIMEVLARDGGGILVQMDPLGDPRDPVRRSLVDLLFYNTWRIVHACSRH